MMRTIADTIRESRQNKGWTQATLANKAGVGRGTVARVECGRGDASPENLQRLLSALGFSPQAIESLARQVPTDPRMRSYFFAAATASAPVSLPDAMPNQW